MAPEVLPVVVRSRASVHLVAHDHEHGPAAGLLDGGPIPSPPGPRPGARPPLLRRSVWCLVKGRTPVGAGVLVV